MNDAQIPDMVDQNDSFPEIFETRDELFERMGLQTQSGFNAKVVEEFNKLEEKHNQLVATLRSLGLPV